MAVAQADRLSVTALLAHWSPTISNWAVAYYSFTWAWLVLRVVGAVPKTAAGCSVVSTRCLSLFACRLLANTWWMWPYYWVFVVILCEAVCRSLYELDFSCSSRRFCEGAHGPAHWVDFSPGSRSLSSSAAHCSLNTSYMLGISSKHPLHPHYPIFATK